MRVPSGFAGVLLVLASSAPAFAHGGSYRIPPDQAPPVKPGVPGSVPTGGDGAPTPSEPASTPDATRGGRRTWTGPDSKDPRGPLTPWEIWWALHRERHLDLRERIASREDPSSVVVSGGGLGRTAGARPGANVAPPPKDPREFHENGILPVLLQLLKDDESEVRSAAAVALGRLGFVRAMPALSRARADEERDVRDGAALALGMLEDGIATEDLRELLFDRREDGRTRGLAAVALGLTGSGEASESLRDFFAREGDARDHDGLRAGRDVVASTVTGLGLAGDPAAVPLLRHALLHRRLLDPRVRCFLPLALARLGDRESVPLLLQALSFRDAPMRQSAAVALGVLAGPADAEVIRALDVRLEREPEPHARLFAAMALARIGGPQATAVLRLHLDSGRFVDRPFLALALGVAGDDAAGRTLRTMFARERTPDVLGALAVSLGLLRDREAAPLLRRVAASSRRTVRLRGYCLTALGMMEDGDTADVAHGILLDEAEPRMRLSAATALGLLRDRRAVPALEDIARNARHVFVRGNAMRLLGVVGGRHAGEVLLEYAKDRRQHVIVRTYATAALGVVGRRSGKPLLARVNMDGNFAVFIDPLEEIALLL